MTLVCRSRGVWLCLAVVIPLKDAKTRRRETTTSFNACAKLAGAGGEGCRFTHLLECGSTFSIQSYGNVKLYVGEGQKGNDPADYEWEAPVLVIPQSMGTMGTQPVPSDEIEISALPQLYTVLVVAEGAAGWFRLQHKTPNECSSGGTGEGEEPRGESVIRMPGGDEIELK